MSIKRFLQLLPLAASLMFVALVTLGVVDIPLRSSEADVSYFVKPVKAERVLIVEPNFGTLLSEGKDDLSVKAALFSALSDINQQFNVSGTKLVKAKRNIIGDVPSLLVYVDPQDPVDLNQQVAMSR